MNTTSIDTNREITLSEIALLKCHTYKDYNGWLKKYGQIPGNPHIATAQQKYEQTFYYGHKSLAGTRKYLKKFPNGKFANQAREKIPTLEAKQKFRNMIWGERLENIGYAINIIIFLSVFLYSFIGKNWSAGESFMATGALVPLYWLIHCITRQKE